jgi:hypothetical protein
MARAALVLAASWLLAACSLVVEPGVTYRDCDLTSYLEEFPRDARTMEELLERCWRLDSAGTDPADAYVDDGDLIMHLNKPAGAPRAQWSGSDRGPLFYQRLEGDFLFAARVEANDFAAGHCLEDGNMAGLVMRRADAPGDWTSLFVGPYDVTEKNCPDESPEGAPPTRLVARTRDDIWGGPIVVDAAPEGIAHDGDGEGDIALCRRDDVVSYFYRVVAKDPEPETWKKIGEHEAVEGPVEIGPAVTGKDPVYSVDGHFNWVIIRQGVQSDHCQGRLEGLVVPEGI